MYSLVHKSSVCYFGKCGVTVIRFKILTKGLGGYELWSLSVCSCGGDDKPLLQMDMSQDRWMADTNSGASCQILTDLKCPMIPYEHEGG